MTATPSLRPTAFGTAALCALLLQACTVGPNFTPPNPQTPAAWHDKSARAADRVDARSNPDPNWWANFNDPTLTRLIQQAIANNPDLRQAVLRVVEARENVAAARAAGLPSLSGTASLNREQLGAKGILESQGAYSSLNSLANANSTLNKDYPGAGTQVARTGTGFLNTVTQPITLFQYGLDASWELDLFGRVRRQVEQAKAQTQAQIEATNDALIMLESEVAQAYMQLRGAQALTASQQANIRTAQDTLNLTITRQGQGLATGLDVEQARAQLADTQRSLPSYENQAQQALNQLSVLVGEPPGTLDAQLSPTAPLPAIPAVVEVGVPSTLARRRPDIRQAEAQLHAATANVGIAVAGFYPDVTLTGSLGLRALDASYLANWASHFYTLGPSLSLPIFQGGRLNASLRLARAQQIEAGLNYRSKVLNALREVENGLVAYRTDRAARARILDELHSAEISLNLARARYVAGVTDFIQVLDAERTLINTRQSLVQIDLTLTNDVVALYRALGGGWEDASAPALTPPALGTPPLTPAALDSVVPAPKSGT
jgi:NodT family efflux transporter outer membrane factor (OMF) lipoprotein